MNTHMYEESPEGFGKVGLAKTIAVSDDVYELLKTVKVPGESYSDVIRRGLKRGLKLADIAGSRTITRREWQRAQKSLRSAELITRRKLGKNSFEGENF